jgi:hypothetical protein
MATLLLTQQPFRTLRSRAILVELARRLASPDPILVATGAPRCPPGFSPVPMECDPGALGVTRVVIAGIFADRAELERALALSARAVAAGAALEVRSLSVENAAGRREVPAGIEVLDRADPLEVREAHTANGLMVWRVAAAIRITPFPERALPADAALARELPAGPVLGLSIVGGAQAGRIWSAHIPALQERLSPFRHWPVLPLPAEGRISPVDDLAGSLDFAARVLPGSPLAVEEKVLRDWREKLLTPQRMAGLVARCAHVVASQDLPAIQAVAAGVPLLGLGMGIGGERRVVNVVATLANQLPPGSDLLYLAAPKP